MKIDNSFLFDLARNMYSDFSYKNRNGHILPPLRYILEITYRCNLSCPFCYLGHNRKLEELNQTDWYKIIDQIPKYAFISFLGGEIFIRDDILNLLKYASNRVMGKINLYTNGTMLTNEYLDELLKIKMLLFSVSIDGIKENHDKFRGLEGLYDKTLSSILYINSHKKQKKLPLTEIKTVILNENLEDLPKLYKLCNDNQINFITFSFLRTTNIRQNPKLSDNFDNNYLTKEYPINKYFDFEKFEEVYKELESLSKNGYTLIRWAPKFKPHASIDSIKYVFENAQKKPFELYKPCKFPFSDIFINPQGDVYPCLPIRMGNLKEQKLSEIINNDKFKDFRKKLKSYKVFTPCNLCCDLYPKY